MLSPSLWPRESSLNSDIGREMRIFERQTELPISLSLEEKIY